MKATRPYRSPHRAAQASATRAAILDAAVELFCARGYAGTTMQAVADEAGVAVESVYGLATKARLLELALERVVVDGSESALADSDAYRAVLEAGDQRTQLRRFGQLGAPIAHRHSALSRAFMQASAVDEKIGAQWREQENRRLSDMRALVAAVAARGPLRPGLTVDSAAVTVWAAFNWYTVWLRCDQSGVDVDELADWISQTLASMLLP